MDNKNDSKHVPQARSLSALSRRKALAGLLGAAAATAAGTKSAKAAWFAEEGGTWATPGPGDPNTNPFAVTGSAILINDTDPNNWLFSMEYRDVSGNRYFTNGTRGAVVFNNGTAAAFFDFTATVEGFAHGRENGIHLYDIIGLDGNALPPLPLDERIFNSLAFVAIDAYRRLSDAVKDGNIWEMSKGTGRMRDVPQEVQDYENGFYIQGFTRDELLGTRPVVIVPGLPGPPGFGYGPYPTSQP